MLDGKQVAVLTPTTVLAFQHWKTFRKRFAPFPVRVEMVSRFRPPREINPGLPAGLPEVIMQAMSVDKDKRYQTMQELRVALEKFR